MINITFGIIGNYCCFNNLIYNGSHATNFTETHDPTMFTLEGNSGWTYLPDMAVIAAVNQINQNPNILPGVHVNLKRFTDCGEFDPSADFEYAGNSGGYASAVTAHDIIDVHKDVVAVVGNQYSSAAKGLNEILSTNKIPVCMASTASPRFSDRNLYPFVFRTITNHYAKGTLLLLKKWKVSRVAVIYQNDDDFGRWGDHMNKTTFGISSDDYSSIVEYNETAPVFFGGAIVPPPDGSLTVTTMYYSLTSIEGIILVSLAVLGVGAGMFCIFILVKNWQEKLVKSASPLDMIVLSIASVLVYTFSLFNVGIPTVFTCKARVSTLSTGISFLLPALIIKNAMLVWLFHQHRRLQKKSIDQMWKRVRLLVYGPVSVAASAFLVWTCNINIRAVQLLHHDTAYFRCQMNNHGETSKFVMLQLVFNGVILLLLFVTAFFTSRIQNTDLNETSKIGFVAVSVIGGFCLVQILSQSPDAMTDFKIAVIVWVVNTFILFTVMGIPVIRLHQSRKYLKRKQRNRNDESSAVFGTSIQTHYMPREQRHVISAYNYIQLNKVMK
ncbi:hypothetical protein HDU80_005172 [Chytriomyces hyalinus]|nr:hypothetical protein HDU80_005172 [Chytriomyces hyalinus]